MPPDPIAIIETVPGVGPFLPYILLATGVAALAIPWLPVPTRARSVYGVFYTVLNYLAQNYRNAQNAKVPEDVPKPAS
jgi:hypothetical protein